MLKRVLMTLLIVFVSLHANNGGEDGIRFEDVNYPFEVKKFVIESNSKQYEMAYMDLLPKKPNGKTVVLLHGKNFTGAYWERIAKALSERGYRVLMPDQIGFGKSSKPEFYEYSFNQLAYNTKSLLNAQGISHIYLIGHSMGGMLAMRFTIMYPDMVEKLILENPIGLEDWQKFVSYPPLDYWIKKELGLSVESMREYQLKAYYDGKWKSEYDKWLELQANPLKSKNFPRAAFNQALIGNMIFTQPVIYEAGKIKAPTLLIIGQRDKTAIGKDLADDKIKSLMGDYVELGRNANRLIANSKLVELYGIGHMPHIEAFELFFGPLINFIEELNFKGKTK
jgi:pimeloyl-ACP methyl ester carboxylesterase